MKKIFTDSEIADFCLATEDPNRIHDPSFMNENGKLPIVPGMLTLTYAANLASDIFLSETTKLDAYFGNPLSPGEPVDVAVANDNSKIFLVANNGGGNALESLEGKTSFSNTNSNQPCSSSESEGVMRYFPITPDQLNKFARIINSNMSINTDFLFSIAYASQALTKSLDEPINREEQALSDQIFGKNILPVYQSIHVQFPNNFGGFSDYNLSYRTSGAPSGKRNYTFSVECLNGDQRIFTAEYNITGIPERVVISRIAKNLEG